MDAWRDAHARATTAAACVHLIVNERHEGGASLPHTHAQLYALDFVPAAIARERERFGAHAVRTMGGNLLGDLVQEEVRRRERLVAVDDEAVLLAPYASRAARTSSCSRRAARAPASRTTARSAPGCCTTRCGRLRAPLRRHAAAEPVGAHRAARGRPLLLADRHPPAPHPARRARARHRRAPVRRRAGAGGGGAAREL